MTLIYAILIFCVLIFVHEFGHFFVAKACGVKVNEFAIGMGPVIYKKQRGETQYSVRALPIGGFCAMEGENEDSDEPRAFNNKPAWKRALVLAAGPIMNFLTCIFLFIIVYMAMGVATTTIGEVSEGYPAEAAGIKAEDTILSIDGNKIDKWSDIAIYTAADNKKKVKIVVDRDGNKLTFNVGLKYDKESNRAILGVLSKGTHNPIEAIKQGCYSTGQMTVMMYKTIKQLVTGEQSAKNLSGPVGIIYVVNESAHAGVINVVYLAALLSLNLGVLNLLPFPALDGGRLVFLVIRKITGKKVTDNMEGAVHFVGLMCLFALMIYVTFNDVIKYIFPLFS